MTPTQVKETLSEVHTKHKNWETNQKAYAYAHDLWNAALQCIENKDDSDEKEVVQQTFELLHITGTLTLCLTDTFRKIIISYHARGYTTTDTIDKILIDEDLTPTTPLKPTHPRWPQKKYGAYWKQIRQEYTDIIHDLPLTHIREQIAKLSEHYITLDAQFNATTNPTEIEKLHKCMMQTLSAINALTHNTDINQTTFQQDIKQILLDAIAQTQPQKQIPPPHPPNKRKSRRRK